MSAPGDTREWDLFIAHASEDKETFVDGLAAQLRSRGYRVWYDEFELKLGDRLLGSINRGLARSRFGVVVLSTAFFEKEWPQWELAGLVARETDGKKVLLPVWHGVGDVEVRAHSPTLADRYAIVSHLGVHRVVAKIVEAIGAPLNVDGTEPEVAPASLSIHWQEGEDEVGAQAVLALDGVKQRFRWIRPGAFLMGSPESEQGRFDDEGPLHHVVLTRGFWLSATPCTQELWAAVTGENPSHFISPRRPVEQVSWEDCRQFLVMVNAHLQGPPLRLPTEAEWEYACRAGADTSTYAGELDIRDEMDGPILDGIAWYGGNSGVQFELTSGTSSVRWSGKQYDHRRAGTHPVAMKTPNAWGLYDMLGNVREWCADWQAGYGSGRQTNPTGPTESTSRVIRGGSWLSEARRVRSACRNWRLPTSRDSTLGFRLARGAE